MSNEDLSEKISIRIDQKLSGISKRSSNRSIFKIHNRLRMKNEADFEPEMVSIGPYHRGKKNLQKMENYKLECLQVILKRQNESSAGRYINSLIQDEEEARSYYADQVGLEQDEFLEMLLLDGCFIVEFLREFGKIDDGHQDSIFKEGWITECLRRDFLLFENQIPFFILHKLFYMTKTDDDQDENLISMVVYCLNDFIRDVNTINYKSSASSSSPPKNIFHLLSLMHECWGSSFVDGVDDDQNGSSSDSCINLGKLCFSNNTRQQQDEEDSVNIGIIKSASELKLDGIEFTKFEKSRSWLDVRFENGEIKIPPIQIQDASCILGNLIAYEHYMFDLGHLRHSRKYVTDYVAFMDCLISTSMDVQELRIKGIINRWFGEDKDVANFFNKICDDVVIIPKYFMYRKIFKQVNEHLNKRCNPWISDLKKTYLKNPWKILSLLGATILLVLTFIQTVFSILK